MDDGVHIGGTGGEGLPVKKSLAVVRSVLFVLTPEDSVGNYQFSVLGWKPSNLKDIVWVEGSCERLWLDVLQLTGGRNNYLGTVVCLK